MNIRIDEEFKALIPPLAEQERQQLEAGKLGFSGSHINGSMLTLHPTPMSPSFWIWAFADAPSMAERFCTKPTAFSRIPKHIFAGIELKPSPMEALTEYPPKPAELERARTTNVYVIQSVIGGPVKIGRANDVGQRLAQHQCGSPFELRVLKVFRGVHLSMERDLHEQYRDFRLHGEWFSAEVLDFLTGEGEQA